MGAKRHRTLPKPTRMLYFWFAAVMAFQTPCNPLLSPCVARNRALSSEVFESFVADSPFFEALMLLPQIVFYENGARLGISERFENPQLASKEYILYGKVEAEIMASLGNGVISSIYLQSDDLDEIDVAEIFGGNLHNYQSNFFVKGNTTTYDRGGHHDLSSSPVHNFHKYGVEWHSERIIWTVDNKVVRQLERDNPQGFPSSPMRIMISLWAGGDPSNSEGTIQWAGGVTTYEDLPYYMCIRNVRMVDYSTGKEYIYAKNRKVIAVNGQVFGRIESSPGSPEDKDERKFVQGVRSNGVSGIGGYLLFLLLLTVFSMFV